MGHQALLVLGVIALVILLLMGAALLGRWLQNSEAQKKQADVLRILRDLPAARTAMSTGELLRRLQLATGKSVELWHLTETLKMLQGAGLIVHDYGRGWYLPSHPSSPPTQQKPRRA